MKKIILDVGYSYIAFDVKSGGLETIASATIVEKNNKLGDNIYLEKPDEVSLKVVPSTAVISPLGSDEGRMIHALKEEKHSADLRIAELKLQIAKEKKFWEDRSKAHALGLTDSEWREQVDKAEYRYALSKLPIKKD